jgi:hypothetical protein
MARQGLRGALAVSALLMVAVPASADAGSGSGGTSPGEGSPSSGNSGSSNSTGRAKMASDGRTAIAPNNAPPAVKRAIAAANRITRKPYRYGGGHGRWEDSGYDCSGSVSFALHGGKFVKAPMDSSQYMGWGKSGKGKWITVYANGGHAFMVVAGLRFDTGYRDAYGRKHGAKPGSGPRWGKPRPTDGFSIRRAKSY